MFMCNDDNICGGRVRLITIVRVCSDMWKYLDRESPIIFPVPLMCCEYRYVLLLTRVHPSQRYTSLCGSAFTGSKDASCIQPSSL